MNFMTQTARHAVCSVGDTNSLIHGTDQDSCWLQFGITSILINAIQWLHRTSSAPSWFDRLEKSHAPVKADLAIYINMPGVPGQYKSTCSVYKLNFSCACQ